MVTMVVEWTALFLSGTLVCLCLMYRRKRTSLMLSKHTQLLELLEIPQVSRQIGGKGRRGEGRGRRDEERQHSAGLCRCRCPLQVMDTCVRSGYHDEALELSTFVKRLNKKHGDIPIIKVISLATRIMIFIAYLLFPTVLVSVQSVVGKTIWNNHRTTQVAGHFHLLKVFLSCKPCFYSVTSWSKRQEGVVAGKDPCG